MSDETIDTTFGELETGERFRLVDRSESSDTFIKGFKVGSGNTRGVSLRDGRIVFLLRNRPVIRGGPVNSRI